MKKKFETRAIHVGQKPEELYGSVSLPIYQTSTFKQEEFGEYTYDYSRAGNPTRNALEITIASLECGSEAAMFSSGMAAISSIFTLLKKNDHLIISGNVYGGTYLLMSQILENFGLSASWVDTTNRELIEKAINGMLTALDPHSSYMNEDTFNASNSETSNYHWFPFLRYKRDCEATGKAISVNEWMREAGKLDAKIAHEESVALAAKIS